MEPDFYLPYADLATGLAMRCYYGRYGQVVHEFFECPKDDGPERSKYIRMLNMAGTGVKGKSAPAQPVAAATATAQTTAKPRPWPDAQPSEWQARAAAVTVKAVAQDLKMTPPRVRWYGDQERAAVGSGRAEGRCKSGDQIDLWIGLAAQRVVMIAAHEAFHAAVRQGAVKVKASDEEGAALAYGNSFSRVKIHFTEQGDYLSI